MDSKHDSFTALLYEVHVVIPVGLQKGALCVNASSSSSSSEKHYPARQITSRAATLATKKRAFGDSKISASSGKKLYLERQW
jgi:hypothetical protein